MAKAKAKGRHNNGIKKFLPWYKGTFRSYDLPRPPLDPPLPL
jgi:hypothetical protein